MGKTVLVDVYSENDPNNVVLAFALIDDQSNQTLATPNLINLELMVKLQK